MSGSGGVTEQRYRVLFVPGSRVLRFLRGCSAGGNAGGPIGAPQQTQSASDGTRVGRKRGIAIASVIAVAVVGGAAGGILLTRQDATTPQTAISPATSGHAKIVPATTSSSPSPTSTAPSPTSTTQSFADLYRNVSRGVVRIRAITCDGGGTGTGFLIAPDLVATVAHVVNESAALKLTIGEKGAGGKTSGVVVGIDPRLTSLWSGWTAGCRDTCSP